MDRAAIFTAVLPLLDVRAEMAHAVSLAALHEYREFCEQHLDTLEQFRAEVLAEYRATKPNFGYTWGGKFAVNLKARRQFEAWIEEAFGVVKPAFEPKNAVVYGSDRDKHQR